MLHVNTSQKKQAIMVVEDNQFQALYLERLLKDSDYEITIAKDGAAAIEMIVSGQVPDAIVTDINMPNKNGFELIAELKKQRIAIPIIITSGRSDNLHFERAFVLGAQSYLVKPYPPTQLLAKLEFLLKK